MPAALLQKILLAKLILLVFLVSSACQRQNPLAEGDAHLTQKRYQQAIDFYRDFYVKNPYAKQAPRALWRIGEINRLNLKDFKKATDAYRVLTKRLPQTKEAHEAQLLLGDLFARHFQNYEQAIVEHQKVVQGKDFDDASKRQATLKTGNAYYAMGNLKQARIEYKKLLKESEGSFEAKQALLQLAHSFDAEGFCKEAIVHYQKVGELSGKADRRLAAQGRFGEAACLEEQGEYEKALKLFEAILEDYPSRRIVEIRMERLAARMHQVVK